MAEPSRYTPEQLSILLRIAAGKLGRDPVKLQEELQNGRLDGRAFADRKGAAPAVPSPPASIPPCWAASPR